MVDRKQPWDAADMAAGEAQNKATRKTNDVGPTGQTVARNLARLRSARGLSTYDLSRLLTKASRPIAPSAITRIEGGIRKVDVDDLMALAVALRVSPTALLMPPTVDPDEAVNITGEGEISADVAWEWTLGERPLSIPADDDGEVWNDFQTMSRPPGRRKYRVSVNAAETPTRRLDTPTRAGWPSDAEPE
jgi:transcriptional regulator with XRE-family HTH domain